jgi:16S rRNA (cytosine1402-N4)-methyltransferase
VLDQLATNDVRVDAILLDLGVSSMQLDRPERGFSYAVDAPLDMRMDPSADETAADVVNDAPERELQEIFRRYGEERYARQIARAISRRRRREQFQRTGDLVDVIKAAIPTPARFGEGHPAKRVFQALRIAVNDELGQLEEALPAALELLRPRGRVAVISFHSLEDRIVKRFFRDGARGCVCPPDFPVCTCGRDPVLRVLTPRAVRPGAQEVALNPRSASARLRVAEKV